MRKCFKKHVAFGLAVLMMLSMFNPFVTAFAEPSNWAGDTAFTGSSLAVPPEAFGVMPRSMPDFTWFTGDFVFTNRGHAHWQTGDPIEGFFGASAPDRPWPFGPVTTYYANFATVASMLHNDSRAIRITGMFLNNNLDPRNVTGVGGNVYLQFEGPSGAVIPGALIHGAGTLVRVGDLTSTAANRAVINMNIPVSAIEAAFTTADSQNLGELVGLRIEATSEWIGIESLALVDDLPSADAELFSARDRVIPAWSGAGTSIAPFTATVNGFANPTTFVAADFSVSAGATVQLYDDDFALAVSQIAIAPNYSNQYINVKVTAADGTAVYYVITVDPTRDEVVWLTGWIPFAGESPLNFNQGGAVLGVNPPTYWQGTQRIDYYADFNAIVLILLGGADLIIEWCSGWGWECRRSVAR